MPDNEITGADSGSVDTLAKTIKNPADFYKYWMGAIELAGSVEKDWREDAKLAVDKFRSEKGNSRGPTFNILYANIQTTCPAIYNSEPAPDVRPRFGEAAGEDPNAQQINADRKNVSQVIERAIAVQSDLYDYNDSLECAVKDRELMGRAVTRARINLVEGPATTDQQTGNAIAGKVLAKHVTWEPVAWDDFRMGPAKRWPDVPWEAFQWLYTRDELTGLNPEIGPKVSLDATVEGSPDKAAATADTFKRARVWEIWDREKRQVYFIAESYKDGPLKVEPDPYRLTGFFPNPKPLYAIKTTDSTVPVCPYVVWVAQQREMDSLTRRIGALIKVIKWRGVYDGAFEQAVNAMKNLDEGEMAPSPQGARALVQGDIEKAFWLMPVQQAVEVVKALYEAREICKQTIYELTGVADILRGSTKANETLGAQKLKAEWGSLRLQSAQRDIQLHVRDLYRMTGEMLSEHFTPEELQAMTGIALTPQQQQLMKSDLSREFNIDIETDGTIKADLSRSQENVGAFVQGLASYFDAVGPAVQAEFMTPVEAVGLLRTFARNFKLGRQADNILDEWAKRLETLAKQPPQPPPPDPKVEAEKIKAASVAESAKAEMAKTQMQGQMDQQTFQMDMQAKQAEFGMKMAMLKADYEKFQAEHAMEMQSRQADAALTVAEHALTADEQARSHEMGERGHEQRLEVMDASAKAKLAAARMKPKPNGGAK